jgi:hypothetical protein
MPVPAIQISICHSATAPQCVCKLRHMCCHQPNMRRESAVAAKHCFRSYSWQGDEILSVYGCKWSSGVRTAASFEGRSNTTETSSLHLASWTHISLRWLLLPWELPLLHRSRHSSQHPNTTVPGTCFSLLASSLEYGLDTSLHKRSKLRGFVGEGRGWEGRSWRRQVVNGRMGEWEMAIFAIHGFQVILKGKLRGCHSACLCRNPGRARNGIFFRRFPSFGKTLPSGD